MQKKWGRYGSVVATEFPAAKVNHALKSLHTDNNLWPVRRILERILPHVVATEQRSFPSCSLAKRHSVFNLGSPTRSYEMGKTGWADAGFLISHVNSNCMPVSVNFVNLTKKTKDWICLFRVGVQFIPKTNVFWWLLIFYFLMIKIFLGNCERDRNKAKESFPLRLSFSDF